MPGYLRDISNNQGAAGGVAAIRDPATVAVYAKATEGLLFKDSLYHGFRDEAKHLGKPFGGYLFLQPEQDGSEQARVFLTHATPRPGDLQPVVDSEVLTVSGWGKAAGTTLDALHELDAHGFRPLLYGSTSFLQNLVAREPRLKGFRVWQAEYGPVLHRIPGLDAVAWQFTDRQTVAKGQLHTDASHVYRTLHQLEIPARANVHHPAPVPEKKPRPPRRRYYTLRKQVPLKPGQTVGFVKDRGYYAKPAPHGSGGGGRGDRAA